MSRLVDPVHLFDAFGCSVLTLAHRQAELEQLRDENEELKRKLRAAVHMLRQNAGEPDCEAPSVLH